jgi:dolichol-phosphate mannosyltransferase
VNSTFSWCVIILAYNEAATLERVIAKTIPVLESITPRFSILIVNDGSTDGTREVSDALVAADQRVHVIHHDTNRGIGHGLRSGYANAEGDIVGMIPADGQFDPEELKGFLPELDGYDVFSSYRKERNYTAVRTLVTTVNRLLIKWFFGLKIRDVNWVKFYKKWILNTIDIQSISPMVETELVVKSIRFHGARLLERESTYHPRSAGKARGASFRHVFRSLLDLFTFYRSL